MRTYTIGEAASHCQMSINSMRRNFDQGYIAGYRIPHHEGCGHRRIPHDKLIEFMDANEIPSHALKLEHFNGEPA